MALLDTLLQASFVTKIVSRIAVPGNMLQRFFGFEEGGKNVERETTAGMRSYNYDIFDNVRDIARGRAPGTGPGTVVRNPVGSNTVTIARAYEKIPDLSYEILSQIRAIGENAGVHDIRGMRYLEKQAQYLRQRQVNFREFMTWIAFLGAGGFNISGDHWEPAISSPNISFSWQIPAGNKTQLNMLGAGSIIDLTWANAAAHIPNHLDNISIAFQQLVGTPLSWILTDSVVWQNIMGNTDVKNQSGTANTVFDLFEVTEERGPDGFKTGLRKAVLKCRPMYTFYITDAGLNLNSTFTKFFNGNQALFGIDLAYRHFLMQEGSEWVKETPWASPSLEYGLHSWLREWDEPARIELHGIQNLVPELTIPKGLAFGTVIF